MVVTPKELRRIVFRTLSRDHSVFLVLVPINKNHLASWLSDGIQIWPHLGGVLQGMPRMFNIISNIKQSAMPLNG
jgi:hypothetical protein